MFGENTDKQAKIAIIVYENKQGFFLPIRSATYPQANDFNL